MWQKRLLRGFSKILNGLLSGFGLIYGNIPHKSVLNDRVVNPLLISAVSYSKSEKGGYDNWMGTRTFACKLRYFASKSMPFEISILHCPFLFFAQVDFAKQFEDSITAVQVAEQAKVVNEYEQQAPTTKRQVLQGRLVKARIQ